MKNLGQLLLFTLLLLNPLSLILLSIFYFLLLISSFIFGIHKSLQDYFKTHFQRYFDANTVTQVDNLNVNVLIRFIASKGPKLSAKEAALVLGEEDILTATLLLSDEKGQASSSGPPTLTAKLKDLATKIFLAPPVAIYLGTRISTHSTLSFIHFTILSIAGLFPFFVRMANIFFRWLVSQIPKFKIFLEFLMNRIVVPLFTLATPLIEFGIQVTVNLSVFLYQSYQQYSPIIYASIKDYFLKLGIWFGTVWQTVQGYVLPVLRQVLQIARQIYPLVMGTVMSLLHLFERLDARYRPIIMPYLQAFLFQIQIIWVISFRIFSLWAVSTWSVISSPYKVGAYIYKQLRIVFTPYINYMVEISNRLFTRVSLGLQKAMQLFVYYGLSLGKGVIFYGKIISKQVIAASLYSYTITKLLFARTKKEVLLLSAKVANLLSWIVKNYRINERLAMLQGTVHEMLNTLFAFLNQSAAMTRGIGEKILAVCQKLMDQIVEIIEGMKASTTAYHREEKKKENIKSK